MFFSPTLSYTYLLFILPETLYHHPYHHDLTNNLVNISWYDIGSKMKLRKPKMYIKGGLKSTLKWLHNISIVLNGCCHGTYPDIKLGTVQHMKWTVSLKWSNSYSNKWYFCVTLILLNFFIFLKLVLFIKWTH